MIGRKFLIKKRQKKLKEKYYNAKPLYIVGLWAKWGILEARYAGKLNDNGDPLTIHYSDCNGLQDLYYIMPWYQETSGLTIAYFFNEKEAKNLVNRLNKGKKTYE